MKLPKYMIDAIKDRRRGNISTERLCEILQINFYEASQRLFDEGMVTGKWLDIPVKRVAEILLSCKGGDAQ